MLRPLRRSTVRALFALLVVGARAEVAEHRVASLPGWDHELPSKQYSGFLPAEETPTPGHERKLHYVFVEAENSPETAPVVLWTNGGPGCSSLEGYMMEMGPLVPDENDPAGQRLTRNPWTWNIHANMLYLEHGVGVGFSYSNGGDVQLDDESDARDVHWFLRNFFFPASPEEGFGEYATNEFYLTGESYAGIYIPHIANTIRLGNLDQAEDASRINLQGFMIGNGCSGSDTFNCGDPPDNTEFLKSSGGMKLDFLHGHGLVGTPLFDDVVDACPDPKPDWGYDPQCSGLTSSVMCGLSAQDFIDQFFNHASCMGPIPEEFLGANLTTSGRWEAEGGLPAGVPAEYLNEAWKDQIWPYIKSSSVDFVEAHNLTDRNTWRMDAPGPELTPFPIPDQWPEGGNTDPLGRRVNLDCCARYDEALERLGTINIYNIDDNECTPGRLSEYGFEHGKVLAAKGIHIDGAGVRSTAFDAAATRTQLRNAHTSSLEEPSRGLDACGGNSFNVNYFNRPDVQRALNVDREGPVTTSDATGWSWSECASAPFFNYTKTTKSHTALYQQHLVPEMRVTIFSGDVDACVPYLGTMRWVDDVVQNKDGVGDRSPWPEIGAGWSAWNADSNVAGYFSSWNVTGSDHTFTFATVKDAGHMVPETQPRAAASLFYRFIHDLPMDHQEATALTITSQPAADSTGDALTLSVTAEGGTAPYSYEWFLDDELVEGSFGETMSVSGPPRSGTYRVRVASALGSSVWSDGVEDSRAQSIVPGDVRVLAAVAAAAFVAGGVVFAMAGWGMRKCRSERESSYTGPLLGKSAA